MLEKKTSEPQASPSREVAPGISGTPVMSPWNPVEGASPGDGTINDPSAKDNKPPGVSDLELFI